MNLTSIICNFVDNNDNILDKQEYIYQLINELEFIYDLYNDSFTDSESEIFSDDEIEELNVTFHNYDSD